jgi:hypothetical protein
VAIRDYLRRQTPPEPTSGATPRASGDTNDPIPVNTIVEQVGPPRSDPMIEYGRTGTINYHGFLQSEEYNADLTPPRQFDIFDRMNLSDPTVRATMLHLTTPIRAAEWGVRPASEDPKDLEIAAAVEYALFKWMETPWDQCLTDQLKYLRHGVAVLEEVYEVRKVGWEYRIPGQADPIIVPPRDMICWRKMGPRLPRTIWRWINDANDELAVVQQRAYFGANQQWKLVDIPVNKCLLLVNEKQGDDWWGVSVLRGAYKPWWLMEAVQRVTAIGLERFFVGTPMARMDQNATDEQRSAMLNTLQEVRSGERSAIVYSPTDGLDCTDEKGDRSIWILQPTHAPPDSIPFLKHLESNIFTNIMARFMDLGQKETGARATAEIQDDPFYLGLLAVARNICDAWNRGPIRRYVDMNWPGVTAYPELTAEKIAPIDAPIIASAAQAYAAVGFLTPDFATEQWVRKQLSMPDKLIDEAYSVAGEIDDDVISEDATQTGAKDTTGMFDLAKQSLDLAKQAMKAGETAKITTAKAPIPAMPRQPRAAPKDSGSGTSLSDDQMLAMAKVVTRLLREAEEALPGGYRRIAAVKAKDLGLLTKAGLSGEQAAYVGVRLEAIVKEQALMALADPTHSIRKGSDTEINALVHHVLGEVV